MQDPCRRRLSSRELPVLPCPALAGSQIPQRATHTVVVLRFGKVVLN